jgi:hypothetical protein
MNKYPDNDVQLESVTTVNRSLERAQIGRFSQLLAVGGSLTALVPRPTPANATDGDHSSNAKPGVEYQLRYEGFHIDDHDGHEEGASSAQRIVWSDSRP